MSATGSDPGAVEPIDEPFARVFERRVGPVTRTQIVRFAGAGGDFNPMHHDEPFAQSAGQPTVFAMGQLSAALLGAFAKDWVGDTQLRSLSVRFTAKVWPGDELDLRGEVVEELLGDDGDPRRRCALTITRADGEVAARGELVASTASVQKANDR